MKSFGDSKRGKYKCQRTHHRLKKCVVTNTFEILCVPLAPGSNPCSDEPQEFIIPVHVSPSLYIYILLHIPKKDEFYSDAGGLFLEATEQGIKSCETQD